MAQEQAPSGGDGGTYDQIPYASFPYKETHPRRMHGVARMMGLDAPDARSCRVLELGCAGGGNLVPMGEQLPGAELVGIDYSQVQIAHAKEFAAGAGVGNVELRHGSIAEVNGGWGKFDYVICHGVYSWVGRELQEHLFRVCQEGLTPGGVAYMSFNTMPGWHQRSWVREAMLFHVRGIEAPQERARAGREFLRALASSPMAKAHHAAALKEELARMEGKGADYVVHDYLAEHNEPSYFEEFMSSAERFGLQYLGDGRVNGSPQEEAWGATKAILEAAGEDVVRREQYLDLMRNCSFRRTYLCRAGVEVKRKGLARRLAGMWVSGQLRSEGQGPDGVVTVVSAAGARYGTNHPAVLEFLQRVMRAQPNAVRVDEEVRPEMREVVRGELVKMWGVNLIEIYVDPPVCAAAGQERPVGSRVARWLAGRGGAVTNLRHEVVGLTDEQRKLLTACDGTRTRAEVAGVAAMRGEEMVAQLYRLGLMAE